MGRWKRIAVRRVRCRRVSCSGPDCSGDPVEMFLNIFRAKACADAVDRALNYGQHDPVPVGETLVWLTDRSGSSSKAALAW